MASKVLVVDDDTHLIAGLQRALRREPYEIVSATSGEQALAVLQETDIDVVVSDQQMPGMDGTYFLRRVKEEHPETVRFMLTGNATLDVAIEAINEGAIMRFFTKPCNHVDLAVTIRQGLEHKKLLAAAKLLLEKNKRQSAVLSQVEREHPGITKLCTDDNGTIMMEEVPEDIDRVIRELAHET